MTILDALLTRIATFNNPFTTDKDWGQIIKNNGFAHTDGLLQKIAIAKETKDSNLLEYTLAIAAKDGVNKRYSKILMQVLPEMWHHSSEDIVTLLEDIKDPASTEVLYNRALDVPDYDDGRALAKKCIWALGAINTAEARAKLLSLERMDDHIIAEAAKTVVTQTKTPPL